MTTIKDALKSNDENRLGEVLQFLRYGLEHGGSGFWG
jgi:hypothetical protein